MYEHGMIAPILALIAWTFVMWIWLYATRIPAMQAAKIDVAKLGKSGEKPTLPPEVTRVADNYNHLHEQPTLFYALALAMQISGLAGPIEIGIAWAYVAIRVIHSIVQATANFIPLRFLLFVLSSVALLALLLHACIGLFA